MENRKIIKYLSGVGKTLLELSKEVEKFGIDEESLNLIKKIGSDLLFKGTTIDLTTITKKLKQNERIGLRPKPFSRKGRKKKKC